LICICSVTWPKSPGKIGEGSLAGTHKGKRHVHYVEVIIVKPAELPEIVVDREFNRKFQLLPTSEFE